MERLERGHPDADQLDQLVGQGRGTLGAVAGVGRGHDLHADLVGVPRHLADPGQHVPTACVEHRVVVVAAGDREVPDDGDGRHDKRPLLGHQRERLGAHVGPVLDTAHAGFDRGSRAAVSVGVGGHRDPCRTRLCHDRAQFGLRVELLARVGVGQPRPLGGVRLHEVDAAGDDRRSHRADRVFPANFLAVHVPQLGMVLKEGLGGGRADVVADGQELGRFEVSGGLEFTHPDIDVVGRAHAAHRRDAGVERASGVSDRGNVDVGVQEAGGEVAAHEVDGGGAGWGFGVEALDDPRDPPVLDHDCRGLRDRAIVHVHDSRVCEDEVLGGGRGGQ